MSLDRREIDDDCRGMWIVHVIVEAWAVEGRLHWGYAWSHGDDKLHVNMQ